MLIKTLILNRNDCILHIGCDCGKLHIFSVFLAMQLIHLIIIRIIDDRGIGIGQNIGGIQHVRALQNTEHRTQNCACNRKGNHDGNNQQNLPDSAVDRAFLSALSAFFRVSGRGWSACAVCAGGACLPCAGRACLSYARSVLRVSPSVLRFTHISSLLFISMCNQNGWNKIHIPPFCEDYTF